MSMIVRLFLLSGLALGLAARPVHGVVLWTDNAENLSLVTPHTTGGYPLVQSDVVAQGSGAFHLAHPMAPTDEWFESNAPITAQADSKLFFLSRLGWATAGQRAQVHVTTNNGMSWSPNLYDQVGTDGAGEGSFSLKTINLAAYAGQSVRFRFFYNFTTGTYYPQTDPGVGWYIDGIQIADQYQKTQYSIGNPSDEAQLYLEYINRARANAFAEANRLAAETDPNILSAYSFFGVTGPNIVNQFQYYVNLDPNDSFAQQAPPLSFNAKLITAAQLHTQDMYNFQFQGHDSSSNPPSPLVPFGDTGDRLDAVGYDWQQYAENVYSYADSPREGHAAFNVDWGDEFHAGDFYNPAFDGQGMQNEAGHRINIHNRELKEVGIGVVNGTNGGVGPQLVTQDFASPGGLATFVTGVVYQDLNGNQFYDLGEGRSGVRVDVAGSAFFALSTASGGYSVPVIGDGVHNISFTGGGYANFSTTATVTGGANVKVDYRVVPGVNYVSDFNDDFKVDAADLAQWRGDFGVDNGSDANGDGRSDGRDFLTWQREFGSGVTSAATVPEPASWLLAALAAIAIRADRRTTHWS